MYRKYQRKFNRKGREDRPQRAQRFLCGPLRRSSRPLRLRFFTTPRRQRFTRDLSVIEVDDITPDDLIILVSLARDHNHITALCIIVRTLNRCASSNEFTIMLA